MNHDSISALEDAYRVLCLFEVYGVDGAADAAEQLLVVIDRAAEIGFDDMSDEPRT